MNDQELRKKISGNQEKWSLNDIKKGMEYFKELNNRYPTAIDFDNFEFLPSARSVQRSHGGLISLRNKLCPDSVSDYTKGLYRSGKAKEMCNRAVQYEEEFYNFLITELPEIRVHEHKIIRPGHICCDFFIYTSNNNGVVLDLFYAQDIFSLAKIINIKEKRYKSIKNPIYFILVGNKNINQTEILNLMNNKKIHLPENIKVIQEELFKKDFSKIIQKIK